MNVLGSMIFMNIFGIMVALAVLSILICVHELGHLLLAKWCNIRVDVFSIGMGKPIWGFQFGETFYQIGQLPFGGFCSFGDDQSGEKDTDPRSLLNSPLWARIFTIIGGSLFNILFAYFIMICMYSIGFKEKQLSNIVFVPEKIMIAENESLQDSPAYLAGIRSGDKILEINKKKVTHFIQILALLASSHKSQKNILIQRDSDTKMFAVDAVYNSNTGQDIIGVQPVIPSVLGRISSNGPAELAGLQEGDKIERINGRPIQYFYELDATVKKGKKMFLGIKRGSLEKIVEVQPILDDKIWAIGIEASLPEKIFVYQHASNIFQAVAMAHANITQTVSQITTSIAKLFSGRMNVQKNISGPIRIVSVLGSIAKTFDLVLIFKFLVMLSLALAIFNMLPIPGLDGGALILHTARSLSKDNRIAEKVISFIEHFGIILVIIFAIFVMFNDIKNIFYMKKDLPSETRSQGSGN